MERVEGVTSYITRISQVRDEVTTIREFVSNIELVCTTMNGVTKPWDIFVEAIVSMDNFPSWDKIQDDFVQEESQRGLMWIWL